MPQQPRPEPPEPIEPPPHPAEPLEIESLHIETPVIDIQDLEHIASDATRVSNKGVRVEPHIDELDERDLAKEDEAALEALEEFEKSVKNQPPG
jgi:hypothetical protein